MIHFFRTYAVLFLIIAFITTGSYAIDEKPMVIVIASYNNSRWYRKNLDSVFSQNYQNYRVIYIDDCSTDKTGENIENYLNKRELIGKCTLVRNNSRLGALANQYRAVHSCDDDDIIVILDGDDWFYHSNVLEIINETYQSDNVWLTHGTFIHWPQEKIEIKCKPYSQLIIEKNSFRTMNCPMPTRTFYAWLFKKIKEEDLMIDGDFFTKTGDAAVMYPMVEMAGERHTFIDDINYVYNSINPISDCRDNLKLQTAYGDYIQHTLPPYKRLIDRYDTP